MIAAIEDVRVSLQTNQPQRIPRNTHHTLQRTQLFAERGREACTHVGGSFATGTRYGQILVATAFEKLAAWLVIESTWKKTDAFFNPVLLGIGKGIVADPEASHAKGATRTRVDAQQERAHTRDRQGARVASRSGTLRGTARTRSR